MDNDLIDVLNDFRNLKINYDIERFKLLSYQLENIMKDYQTLMETRKEIQEKYFEIMENINKNGMYRYDTPHYIFIYYLRSSRK